MQGGATCLILDTAQCHFGRGNDLAQHTFQEDENLFLSSFFFSLLWILKNLFLAHPERRPAYDLACRKLKRIRRGSEHIKAWRGTARAAGREVKGGSVDPLD